MRAGVRVVSEESAETGADEPITVVIDPIDGSTNCARGIAYWCTSLCAIDADGAFVALVANHATGQRTSAVRGEGAFRDGVQLEASSTKNIEESVIALGGWPRVMLRAKQTRMLGSIALELCDVAAGGLDGHVDGGRYMAPWDYLGGLLVCREAGRGGARRTRRGTRHRRRRRGADRAAGPGTRGRTATATASELASDAARVAATLD